MSQLIGKDSIIEKIMNEPQPLPRKVPDYMRTKGGFWYWTGAMVMTAFFYEVITGLILLLFYTPSNAYVSTMDFINQIPYGAIITTSHLYGAYAMIVLLYLHLLRNLFVGAFKKPREMQWLTGLLLLVLTIGVSFFGYSLIGDALSADAADVGKGIAQGFPVIGWWLALVFFGGGSNLSLFSRLLAWHIVLAAGIGILFGVHFFLAEYNTIMPRVEKNADKAPLVDNDTLGYKPWYPYNLVYMGQIMLLVMGIIILIPAVLATLPNVPALFSPFPQAAPGTPAAANLPAYPPWFLLFIYKELDFNISEVIGPFWGTVIFIGIPLIYLLLLPKLDVAPTLRLQNRPTTIAFGIIGIFYLAGLSLWGALSPGVPVPNWEFLLFFAAIGVPVYLVTSFTYEKMRRDSFRMRYPGILIIDLGLLGISAFGSGLLIVNVMRSLSLFGEIAVILSVMVTAILAVIAYGIVKGVFKDKKDPRPMTARAYTFAGSLYAFGAVVILGLMLVIKPEGAYNASLYGIGLGLLLIISSMLLRIYRLNAYEE